MTYSYHLHLLGQDRVVEWSQSCLVCDFDVGSSAEQCLYRRLALKNCIPRHDALSHHPLVRPPLPGEVGSAPRCCAL